MICLFMIEIEVVIEVLSMFCYDYLIDLLLFAAASVATIAWSGCGILRLLIRCWIEPAIAYNSSKVGLVVVI